MGHFCVYLRVIRVQQWHKNVLIALAPFSAGAILETAVLMDLCVTMVGFSLISSSVYLINDIYDRDLDRLHPKKRLRPLALGTVSVAKAIILAIALVVTASTLLLSINSLVFAVSMCYLLLQMVYAVRLKHIPVIELFFVSSGFLFRLFIGALAASIEPSSWLVSVVGSGALLVVSGKRLTETRRVNSGTYLSGTRPVLRFYSVEALLLIVSLSATCSTVSFIAWAFQDRFQDNLAVSFSTVPYLFFIVTYLNQLLSTEQGAEEPETDLFNLTFLVPAILLGCMLMVGLY